MCFSKCDSARPCLLCVHSNSKCEVARDSAFSRDSAEQHRPAKRLSSRAPFGENVTNRNPAYIDEVTNSGRPIANEQPCANASTVNFARQVFNEAETGRSLTRGVLPGDTPNTGATNSTWCLTELQLPPDELMWAAIDAYFSRTNWLLGLVHELSFRKNAKRIFASVTWAQRDIGRVLLTLTVAALGLKAALTDSMWSGHTILSFLGLNGCDLMKRLVTEIRFHLLDLMEDPCIESIQTCMLLSSLYGYHGSPSLAWTLARMAINAAIYMELHKVTPNEEGTAPAHVRQHVWNTVVILDTYTSIIYGRSVSTDAAFVGS